MLAFAAEEKGIQLASTAEPDLPTRIEGDERRLRQVLINLIGNAIKFTQTGQVLLQVSRLDADNRQERHVVLRFEVIDSGIGLSADQIEEIFSPFEQANHGKFPAEGVGLGLPISQRLVQLMGGEIQVESQPGLGSRFWFDLIVPCVEDAPNMVQRFATTPGGSAARCRRGEARGCAAAAGRASAILRAGRHGRHARHRTRSDPAGRRVGSLPTLCGAVAGPGRKFRRCGYFGAGSA